MSPQTAAAGNFGIGVVSSVLSGLGAKQAGQQEQAAYNYNADVTMQDTANTIVSNEQRYSTLIGKQATAYAAAGVDITRGSPLLMMAATAGRGGRQSEEILQAGTEKATLDRYYGKVAAFKGTMTGIGDFLSGISTASQQYLMATCYQPSDSGGGDVDTSQIDFGISGN